MDIRTKALIVTSGLFTLLYLLAPSGSPLEIAGMVIGLSSGLAAVWSDRVSTKHERDHKGVSVTH